jgi:hypothetical protein
MRIIKFSVALLIGVLAISCSQPEQMVVIKQGNPQQFIMSANGILDVFSVSGPVQRCVAESNEHGLLPMETYWEIAPITDFDAAQFKERGPIIYGRLPDGFRQVTPTSGEPPPTCKGYPYHVNLATRNGDHVSMFFEVHEDGTILTEADLNQ